MKVVEKILYGQVKSLRDSELVLGFVPFGGAGVTIGRTFELAFSLAI
jgi:hypothetical protein